MGARPETPPAHDQRMGGASRCRNVPPRALCVRTRSQSAAVAVAVAWSAIASTATAIGLYHRRLFFSAEAPDSTLRPFAYSLNVALGAAAAPGEGSDRRRFGG